MTSPADPGQKGSSETFHDGMSNAGHEEQMHGGSQSDSERDSGHEAEEK